MTISEDNVQMPQKQKPVVRSDSLYSITIDAIYNNHCLFQALVPSETDLPGIRRIPLKTSLFIVRMLSVSGSRADRNVSPICTQRRCVAANIDEF